MFSIANTKGFTPPSVKPRSLERRAGFTPPPVKKCRSLERGCKLMLKSLSPKPCVLTQGAGFTLVEMIMVIVIMGIIGGIGISLILSASDALSFLTLRVDMDQSADVAMSRMTQEIRRLRDDESINTATSSQFRFLDVDDTDITYSLSGSNLMRNSDILASNVDSLTFTYYDSSGAVLSPPTFGIGTATDIRRVQILLSFENGAYQFNYQSQVRPRNIE